MELGTDTVVVITGAGSGIGLAMANAFAAAGCKLVLADINEDDLTTADGEVRAAHGVETMTSVTDVSQAEQVEALATATVERFGAVHVVCNNAGVTGKGDPWIGPIETWTWTMGVNFWGVVHGVRAFLPRILESGGGHIVNTASIAGLFPGFGAAYDASKHAVIAVTEDLYTSMEMSPVPIGVSCVCPGFVRTGILDADRNWPDELGNKPEYDTAQTVLFKHARTAIAEGIQPAVVADLVINAVRENRFWVFPHADWLELVRDRFGAIGEGINPQQPEQSPGMPPREQLMGEAMAAVLAELEAQ
ncbi:MAG: SDR family NAD(P)-dependent oxidoreductase [Actinomycetota bacterium]